ncbi:major coat protein [Janthinobacterium sp. AD80]|uniref:major coat protein n=1 Tax=Janthinobacterium sp. AD80 TaxID=1528773 RepID=UPI0011AFCBC0|nr:major coat protein [Janthinobacterium sp. AD80]
MKAIVQKATAAASAMAATGAAFAAGDPGVDAITALSTQAQTYITAAFAVAVLVAGGFWGIKMMKKAFSKAG